MFCKQGVRGSSPLGSTFRRIAGIPEGAYGRHNGGRSSGYRKPEGGQGTKRTQGRRLKTTKVSDIPMKATRWLWREDRSHWLPMGELVGLGGREGVGKSTWCVHLAALVTRGELPGDFCGVPKGVVIVTTEDDWQATIKPRLVAAGADLDRVYQITAVGADGLEDIVSLPNDLAELERIIISHGVAQVILDPLLTMINKRLDTHKDAEVRQALEPVVKVAHDTKTSLIGLIHVNKTNEGDLMNRLMASRAIGAVVRGVLFCAIYKSLEARAADDHDADSSDRITIDLSAMGGLRSCSARSRAICRPSPLNRSSTTSKAWRSDTTPRSPRTSRGPT